MSNIVYRIEYFNNNLNCWRQSTYGCSEWDRENGFSTKELAQRHLNKMNKTSWNIYPLRITKFLDDGLLDQEIRY